MTRRLTVALIGVVVATLVLSGLGTTLLARLDARNAAEEYVARQADVVLLVLQSLVGDEEPDAQRLAAYIERLRRSQEVLRGLRLEGVGLAVRGPRGNVQASLPNGLTAETLGLDDLPAGATATGERGRLVWAVASEPVGPGGRWTVFAVATRSVSTDLGRLGRWFVVSSIVTLGLGGAVALGLAKRLARPVREADLAARAIAAGHLDVRLPDPPADADDELSDLARSVNSMASSLERSRALEQQFLLSVSHDLRTPLTSIKGWSEAIVDGATDDPVRAAGVINTESRRLERLVSDLLDLAKLDARAFSLDLGPVDLVDVAHEVASGAGSEAADHGVEIVVTTPAGPPPVAWADRDRVGQLLANLVANALRYARTTVTISVEPALVDGAVPGARLSVTDDGPGIAPADLPHVFERLYRSSHQPVRAESGSGLGLAIVRELTAAMHGHAWAENRPGGGARLSVDLPAQVAR